MSIPLDPREVLQTLNSLGYKNISAGQLKEFIKDLKRFIIYENRYSNVEEVFHTIVNKSKSTPVSLELSHFDRLHISTTHSTRAKTAPAIPTPSDKLGTKNTHETPRNRYRNQESNQENQRTGRNINHTHADAHTIRSTSAETSAQSSRRGVIPIPPQIVSAAPSVASRATSTTSINRRKLIRNTPTDLYQYYQKDWDRFKQYLPGEASRTSIRNEVRRKMEHPLPPKQKVYFSVGPGHKKVLTRL